MAWQSGIEKLSTSIADRMGYQDIPLQLVLRKLLVYGEGGGVGKHQDSENDGDSFVTLVVQLPSCHEGGNLVIYHDGVIKGCHDFGKTDGTSAYLPHYAVHYADAEYAMEKVTKGYRLVLVYSICLPSTMRHLEKPHNVPLSEDLASAISNMDDENDSFALLLTHDYDVRCIEDLGVGALKGFDDVRFNALEEANTFAPKAKKLKFFIVQLVQKVKFWQDRFTGDWEVGERRNDIRWYTTSGKSLGKVKRSKTSFNFLNPEQETLSKLWVSRGTKTVGCGMCGDQNSTYTRYAIVAWREAQHEKQTFKNMPLDIAIETLYACKPIDGVTLLKFMDEMDARRRAEKEYSQPDPLSAKFCQLFCEMAADAGDSCY